MTRTAMWAVLAGLLAGAAGAQTPPPAGQPKQPPPPTQPPAKEPAPTRFDGAVFIKKYDKNNDGQLSKDELPESMRDAFARIDKNNDGMLSAEELNRHAVWMRRTVPVEVVSFWVAEVERDPPALEDLQHAYDALRKLDADNDGKITAAELAAGKEKLLDQRIDSFFKRFDLNKDDKISKEEAEWLAGMGFEKLDTNNDGFVTRDEMKQAAKVREQGTPPPPKTPPEKK